MDHRQRGRRCLEVVVVLRREKVLQEVWLELLHVLGQCQALDRRHRRLDVEENLRVRSKAVFPGPKKLKELTRWTPARITEWRFRRLLKALYWSIEILVTWFAEEAIQTFPAPEDVGPKKTKLIVTNLTEYTPRQIACIYQRRWSVELLMKELKTGLGLGQHQVTKTVDRVEKSIGIAFLGYLFLLRASRKEIRPGQSWSIFQLQNAFRLQVITHQIQHTDGGGPT